MRRFFIFMGPLILAAVPIAYLLLKAPPIEVKPLLRKNPTSFVFHSSIRAVIRIIESMDPGQAPLVVGKRYNFFLGALHDPIGKSAVYFARGEALDYLAEFNLCIRKRGDEETAVQVDTTRSEVIAGKKFGFGSCGPGFANRYVAVEPTTIEEYEILLKIGRALGEKDMPPLILPQ